MPKLCRQSITELERNVRERQMTHTPGPWRSGDRYNTVFGPPNGQPSPQTIATIQRGNEANARLIAAAPELLEVAKKMVADHDELSPTLIGMPLNVANSTIDAARAAIAKAEGK
jgi:hypothetical protein